MMETCEMCGEPCADRWPVAIVGLYDDDGKGIALVCADCEDELNA